MVNRFYCMALCHSQTPHHVKNVMYVIPFNCEMDYYPPTKSEGYSFGVVRPLHLSVHTFCLSGTISQYLFVRFDSILVQMMTTMDSRYPISLVIIDPLTLELLSLL